MLKDKIDAALLGDLAGRGKLSHQAFFAGEKTLFEKLLTQKWKIPLNNFTLESTQKVIVSVFVPSHKPLNQFGMNSNSLREI